MCCFQPCKSLPVLWLMYKLLTEDGGWCHRCVLRCLLSFTKSRLSSLSFYLWGEKTQNTSSMEKRLNSFKLPESMERYWKLFWRIWMTSNFLDCWDIGLRPNFAAITKPSGTLKNRFKKPSGNMRLNKSVLLLQF